jgi:uncharacterized Zn-binding protein involved in type VI secretion
MGQPAARIGDTSLHGGSIVVGCPTVLIGSMPAARMGDMHVCPMVTPGTPPIPHVGGPIMKGSTGVLIGGMPAARMGDMALCTGPPDSIMMGCMTVLIGEAGAGGGGGGGAGAGGAGNGSAAKGAIASSAIAGKDPQPEEIEGHYLDVEFVDDGSFPVGGVRYIIENPDGQKAGGVLAGEIKRNGVSEGQHTITLVAICDARWDKEEAEVGDTVSMVVNTMGIEKGTPVSLAVFVRDTNYTDRLLDTIETTVGSDKIEEKWELAVDEKYLKISGEKAEKGKYSQPFFFYEVAVGGLKERSALLYYKDWVEVQVKDDEGTVIKDKKYSMRLPSGENKEGTLDAEGKMKVKKVAPGSMNLTLKINQ